METPTTPTDNNGVPGSESQPTKRRRKKSIVWEHFTIETVGAGCTRACCNQCKRSFAYITGSRMAGTSHLKRHISLGICPVSRQKNQMTPYTPGSKTDATDVPKRRYTRAHASFSFDQDRCSHEIAKMIIMHEYPLHIVEQQGFINFVRSLQPQFNMVTFNTIQDECVAIYHREKQSLLNLIIGSPGRISLTVDLWTSNQNLGYVFLTGHFVDSDWNSFSQILNVVMVPSPDSGDTFSQAILTCLSDWHVEGRLFTITLDQSLSNETIIGNLKGLLSVKNPHMLNSQLLIRNCYARVLGRLAQDILGALSEIIMKVRESVKFVKTSESHEEKFVQLKQQLQVPSTKKLSIDDRTKWDTTYHMLVSACEMREVFACLDTYDSDYKIIISLEEWSQVETLCTYVKYLFDAANVVAEPAYPTANVFFPIISQIQVELMQAAMSEDSFVSSLIRPLYERFDRYWENCCLVLAIAVIMDPRYKKQFVDFTFSKIYGENAETWIRLVDDGLHELFLEYMMRMLSLPETLMVEGNEDIIRSDPPEAAEASHEEAADGLSDFDIYLSDITGGQQMKSELEQYLEESILTPRAQDFDILGWWKEKTTKYPTLSKMASDVLSIPVSTVAPDSVFNTELKKMDSYRTSLGAANLEALICAKDWLRHGPFPQPEPQPLEVSNDMVKMEFLA
ncbi:putative transcription factor/ chromatin remodeling BED-type(Zn) family [Rosa chinensis]|uniref:Putative transcription factor/ chromatin remodeling BED-type(Zn) family n=1 Tax=Rosa chinensis TaxID=74649 RepID=A0A2P6RVZ5_ROSCH|nr:zinc finger BED domain-containing protein DAYSLEEPER [Rosa chinensis]PRQ50593.1 putative transcription factor/ chromatin remodeling BED-type(Zn) family [Rosa chinensis]